jgi:hypothetical protein
VCTKFWAREPEERRHIAIQRLAREDNIKTYLGSTWLRTECKRPVNTELKCSVVRKTKISEVAERHCLMDSAETGNRICGFTSGDNGSALVDS